MKKHRKQLNLLFLLTFLCVTLFINFLHTEESISGTDNCPACQFLHSSFTTSHIHFFHLPPPSISGLLEAQETYNPTSFALIKPSSRSPPSV